MERTARGDSGTFLQGLKQATDAQQATGTHAEPEHARGAKETFLQATGAQHATGAQATGLQAADFTTTTGSAGAACTAATGSTATFGSAEVRT